MLPLTKAVLPLAAAFGSAATPPLAAALPKAFFREGTMFRLGLRVAMMWAPVVPAGAPALRASGAAGGGLWCAAAGGHPASDGNPCMQRLRGNAQSPQHIACRSAEPFCWVAALMRAAGNG
jgi:hypothetical protein